MTKAPRKRGSHASVRWALVHREGWFPGQYCWPPSGPEAPAIPTFRTRKAARAARALMTSYRKAVRAVRVIVSIEEEWS